MTFVLSSGRFTLGGEKRVIACLEGIVGFRLMISVRVGLLH